MEDKARSRSNLFLKSPTLQYDLAMKLLFSRSIDWSRTFGQLQEALIGSGLQVTQSFDLQTARATLLDPSCCPCPYHGSPDCTCQYLVLLVSQGDDPPVSLVVHGHDNSTYISLIQPEPEARDVQLEVRIVAAIRTLASEPDNLPD
jgi:hypothetical protein